MTRILTTKDAAPYVLDWRTARIQEAHLSLPGGQVDASAFASLNFTGGLAATPATETDRAAVQDFLWTVPVGTMWILSGVDLSYDTGAGLDGAVAGHVTVDPHPNVLTGLGEQVSDAQAGRFRRSFSAGDVTGSVRVSWEHPLILPEGATIGVFRITEGTAAPYRAASPDYIQVTNHPYWDAQNIVGALGDSTMWTLQGETNPAGRYLAVHRVVDGLRMKGADVRLCNFSFGGATSGAALTALRSGIWSAAIARMRSFHVQLGMNDGGAFGKAQYKANIQGIVDHLAIVGPELHVFLHTVPASDRPHWAINELADGATKTRRAHYNDALAEIAAANVAAGRPTVVVPLHTARSDTDGTRFAPGETAGNRIHPNIEGMASDSVVIAQAVQTSAFYSNVLKLTGALTATTPPRVS